MDLASNILPPISLVDKIIAEKSLHEFIKQAWPTVLPSVPFVDGWHIGAICEHLQATMPRPISYGQDSKDNRIVTEYGPGEITRLVINIPFRHTKSLVLAVMFPAWAWTQLPWLGFLFASYAERLSIRDSMKTRRLVKSNWYQGNWADKFEMVDDQDQKIKFENKKGGYRIATSVGGVGTGEGGDYVCLTGDVKIKTDQGNIEIEKIVEENLLVEVLTYNHDNNKLEYKNIEVYEKSPVRDLIEIELENGTKLCCTEDHPIYVFRDKEKSYISANQLEVGNQLFTTKKTVKIKNIKKVQKQDKFVYNLAIADNKNYFANGIQVHNCADDPHNISDIESDVKRNSTILWWDESMASRFNNPSYGVKIIIMQRTHDDDLSGHSLAKDAGYEHLCLPARFEVDHPTLSRTSLNFVDPRKEDGELLWPQMFNEKGMDDLEKELNSPYAVAGQLQDTGK